MLILVFPHSPEPLPMPINAVPASPMIVRTSAKSTLISPGLCVCEEGRMGEERGCGAWGRSMREIRREIVINFSILSTDFFDHVEIETP